MRLPRREHNQPCGREGAGYQGSGARGGEQGQGEKEHAISRGAWRAGLGKQTFWPGGDSAVRRESGGRRSEAGTVSQGQSGAGGTLPGPWALTPSSKKQGQEFLQGLRGVREAALQFRPDVCRDALCDRLVSALLLKSAHCCLKPDSTTWHSF